ncbi:MAG: methyltransferase domain-containing protein [Phycisphaerae bacterium]|nr:methyltransferase domain-containing protein [Phycisphaerae bacterium]
MSDAAVQRFYRFHACVYDATRWVVLHGRRQAVQQLRLRPDSRVLEVGCGTGLNFRHILEHLDPVRGRLVGVDFSPHMLVRARRRVAAQKWNHVELREGDATCLRLDEPFDAVLFAYSLSMIPDWRAALELARDHLREGGRIVVLDFSTFDGWGPAAPIARAWLGVHHVRPDRSHAEAVRAAFADVEVRHFWGKYCFIAAGTKARTASAGAGAGVPV